MAAAKAKARGKTAAEAELEQRDQTADPSEPLKEQAKEQRQQQRAELAAGKKGPSGPKLKTVSAQRTGNPDEKPIGGTVDNMTQRDGSEPLLGHFVRIDYSKANAKQIVKDQLAPKGSALADQGFEPGIGSADYGVFYEVGVVGDDGYPETAVVVLRDEHAARINVPYEALVRDTAGGRR